MSVVGKLKIRESHLDNLSKTTESFTSAVNNMTNILSNVYTYIQVNNHNKASLKKASLANIDGMMRLTNSIKYKDIIGKIVTDVESTKNFITRSMDKT